MTKNRIWVGFIVLALLCAGACTTVKWSANPDYNYAPWPWPQRIPIYNYVVPQERFVIVGVVSIDTTWSLNNAEASSKIRRIAAAMGGNGIVITSSRVNVQQFNNYVTTGHATASANSVTWSTYTYNAGFAIEQHLLYGYVIRFLAPLPDEEVIWDVGS